MEWCKDGLRTGSGSGGDVIRINEILFIDFVSFGFDSTSLDQLSGTELVVFTTCIVLEYQPIVNRVMTLVPGYRCPTKPGLHICKLPGIARRYLHVQVDQDMPNFEAAVGAGFSEFGVLTRCIPAGSKCSHPR